MSIDGIVSRIERDALAEAERIKQEYISQISELEHKFETERRKKLAAAQELAQNERKKAHQRALAHSQRIIAQRILAQKMKILDELYSATREHITNLPPDEYRELFAKIISKFRRTEGSIIVAEDRNVLNEEFISLAEQKTSAEIGNDCKFSLVTVDEHWRGCYLECGKIRYNATIDAIMQSIREKTEAIAIKHLFSDG